METYYYHPLFSSSMCLGTCCTLVCPQILLSLTWRPRSKFKLFTTLWSHLFGNHCPEPQGSDDKNYSAGPGRCHLAMDGPKTQNQAQGGQGPSETVRDSPLLATLLLCIRYLVWQAPLSFFVALYMCYVLCYPDILKGPCPWNIIQPLKRRKFWHLL